MSHPIVHARSSFARFPSVLYPLHLSVHNWLDSSKEHYANFRHRAFYHHDRGVQQAVDKFGEWAREIAICHVKEDCGGRVPCHEEWWEDYTPPLVFTNKTVDPFSGWFEASTFPQYKCHSFGIYEAERKFGIEYAGNLTRPMAERFLLANFKGLLTVQQWFAGIKHKRWMFNEVKK